MNYQLSHNMEEHGHTLVIMDDERFDDHIKDVTTLPEIPDRTSGIRKTLKESFGRDRSVLWLSPKEIDNDVLEKVHNKHYINHVMKKCVEATSDSSIRWIQNNLEVCVTKGSKWAILHAAGSGVQAVDLVLDPDSSIQRAFCNVRPPGHHAFEGKCMGFCIFNNIWIASKYALDHHTQPKIVVLDWDVHHGNGTEDFINKTQTDRLLYIGTQQDFKTIWPLTGKPGEDKGMCRNINRYNFSELDGDAEVKKLWKGKILGKIQKFGPDLILISCGFDAHVADPLGKLAFSSQIFGWMTKRLRRICPKIISMLEGGYDCPAISEAARFHVQNLI